MKYFFMYKKLPMKSQPPPARHVVAALESFAAMSRRALMPRKAAPNCRAEARYGITSTSPKPQRNCFFLLGMVLLMNMKLYGRVRHASTMRRKSSLDRYAL
jgi:hypothetical protein